MKLILPVVTERYEIRNPLFHTPAIKHKFAECSLQYCLINQLNSEICFALSTDEVSTNTFYSFKVFINGRIFFVKIYFIQKKTNRQKKYIYTLQNLYTHTINIEHIIYMQESSGQPHIDQYRSKLYSLYTSNDRL